MVNCWLCGSFYQNAVPPPPSLSSCSSVTHQPNYLTVRRAVDVDVPPASSYNWFPPLVVVLFWKVVWGGIHGIILPPRETMMQLWSVAHNCLGLVIFFSFVIWPLFCNTMYCLHIKRTIFDAYKYIHISFIQYWEWVTSESHRRKLLLHCSLWAETFKHIPPPEPEVQHAESNVAVVFYPVWIGDDLLFKHGCLYKSVICDIYVSVTGCLTL